ncbi:MAG: flagellar protein FlaG [Pseudomonadota bacterium]
MDIGSSKDSAGLLQAQSSARAQASDSAALLVRADKTRESAIVEKAAEPTREASRDEVEGAVATIQEFVQSVRRSINFSMEEGDGGRVVVKVTDAQSGDVIRQIPSEEALQLAENLSEVRSLLFKAEA